jgi:Uma2 family endonuclease
MATTTAAITVEQFLRMLQPQEGYNELRNGEVVFVTFPRHIHYDIQQRVRRALEAVACDFGQVGIEFAFRARPEYELRRADVALVSKKRYDAIDPESQLAGAPDLTVEVESPSNTSAELDEKESLCLSNGAVEFWIVYPMKRYVRVATATTTRRYAMGDSIPLTAIPGQMVSVADLFPEPSTNPNS